MERRYLTAAAAVCLLPMAPTNVQAAAIARSQQPIETIVVVGRNVYRDRTEDLNPTLRYDLEFFQPFEPLTVGEMLKRVPGVAFSSDVLEFDGVQLRGLAAQYTTILINGREIPGQGGDGSFFVDRIPAELVDDVEIIRSPSANMTSEGIGGALNVVLKDGAALDGVLARVGATYYGNDDGEFRGQAAAATAGSGPGYDYWVGFNVQERRNPKEKVEQYFDADTGVMEGFALESDVRDGNDWSFNGSVRADVGNGEVRAEAFYVFTDRTETEINRVFDGALAGGGTLDEIEGQVENIDQTTYGADVAYALPIGDDRLEVNGGIRGYGEDTDEVERLFDLDGVTILEEEEGSIDIDDVGYRVGAEYLLAFGTASELAFGAEARINEREGSQLGTLFDNEAEIQERRIAPYVVYTLEPFESANLELGARWDNYRREVDSEDGSATSDSSELLPSAHVRYDLSSRDRLRLSVARTLRRPDFDLTTPFEEDETPDDDDAVVGNPNLDVETAWGIDAGYERRIGSQGVFGINFFYRDIEDLIEIADTGIAFGAGRLFTPLNVGDGWTRGVEIDISTPLNMIGLPETGFYANYTYMDSEVRDQFTGDRRRFRNQPDEVFNVSLVQNVPAVNATFGASLQSRGDSLATEFDEYVTLSYEDNLEIFYEQRLGRSTVVRLSGTNLLDQEKTETFRDFGEGVSEIELEESTPTVTLTVRTAF